MTFFFILREAKKSHEEENSLTHTVTGHQQWHMGTRARKRVNWKMRMKIGIEKGTKELSDQERERDSEARERPKILFLCNEVRYNDKFFFLSMN